MFKTSYFQDLQATFRQTLTESAYILKSQATFLGKCINQARPYHDAVRKAKQVWNFAVLIYIILKCSKKCHICFVKLNVSGLALPQ